MVHSINQVKGVQTTSNILMVRPASFGFNPETASTNSFQKKGDVHRESLRKKVSKEFDNMVQTLRNHQVNVIVCDDSKEPEKPDAIFPNNWISTHNDGTVMLYPMFAQNRRAERSLPVIDILLKQFKVTAIHNWSWMEGLPAFLEGTGSMVFDHVNKIAFASESQRTSSSAFKIFCKAIQYRALLFGAIGQDDQPIYHTNVLLSVGTDVAVVCSECISRNKNVVLERLSETKKLVIEISIDQMNAFAGNMLEVKNNAGDSLMILSDSAYNALKNSQRKSLKKYVKLVPIPVATIENYGGGSVRCMMAEIFLTPIAKSA
ncbi:MAG: hypothetical protein ACI8SE_000360 [Bacteroidia bacterium]